MAFLYRLHPVRRILRRFGLKVAYFRVNLRAVLGLPRPIESRKGSSPLVFPRCRLTVYITRKRTV